MPLTIAVNLKTAKDKLSLITESPLLEAEILLAHILKQPRIYLHTWPERMLSADEQQQFDEIIQRRSHREPIAYITGIKEFWSLELVVNPDVLIPRPETELLVEAVLRLLPKDMLSDVADLGTGSGAIALAVAHERPHWQVHAVDVSDNALHVASKNAQRLMLTNISFYLGSWCTALPRIGFDAIVSNPPYLAETEWEDYADGLVFEPRGALLAGQDGLVAIRAIVLDAKRYLKSGGYLLLEHGFSQGSAVRDILSAAGYQDIATFSDLNNQERVTIGVYFLE
jgi:release factor glutamine methyltransferase